MKFKKRERAGLSQQKKSRKQIRKEKRVQKKVRKNDYYNRRSKTDQPDALSINNNQVNIAVKPKPKQISHNSEDQVHRARLKEKKEHAQLKKDIVKQRKRALLDANTYEDKNIKRLEKQLKINKLKVKKTPKSFVDDGLDYLLEVCDAENMKAAVAAEQQFADVNDDFEEDFALMTGQELNKQSDGDLDEVGSLGDSSEFSEEEEPPLKESKQQANAIEESDNDDFEEDGSEFESSENEDFDPKISVSKKRTKSLPTTTVKSKKLKIDDSDDSESEGSEPGEDVDLVQSEDQSDEEGKSEAKSDVWEDIYGRLRGKNGEIIEDNKEKYIPPAIRAKMEAEVCTDKKRVVKMERLRRQLKGFLNRLAESNMHSIATQIEELYMNNSRNDMNDTLTSLILESVVSPVLTPERLLLEHVMLITILHANVGTEVGAHFLQTVIKQFEQLFNERSSVENKKFDNIIWVLAQLFNFKVFHVNLIYEIVQKLSDRFTETDIECILLVLKSVGFTMRKEDPLALKNLILNLQKQANNAGEELKNNARVKFMLEILLAVKNNNMTKIPNYDISYSEHLRKLLKNFIRKGSYVTTLNISLQDLLNADESGKWWVVGSAWSGKTETQQPKEESKKSEAYSQKLLDLARKQRMNTDTRRSIFCILMSSEDYLDAFENLLHLGLKSQQEREIVHVILHCCLQEKQFNPYYAVLAHKFCEYDRRFQMTIKYSIWDKLKAISECSTSQLSNLAKLLTHLFLAKGLPISVLKIVQFGELDKITLRFMRQILIGILLCDDDEMCQGVFLNVARSEKLKLFKQSLRLFIQHFLLRNLKSGTIPENQLQLLQKRAAIVDKILSFTKRQL